MKTDYTKLEKDNSFKKSYINSTLWWKNILLAPPILLLFGGLIGIIYIFHLDKLVSWYILPYLILFVVGTILLKATKKYLQKGMMTTPGSFIVCLAKPIGEKDGYTYAAFVKDTHRHNKHYINNETKDLSFDEIIASGQPFTKKSMPLGEKEIYIRAYPTKEITKRNASWREEDIFPILYIDDKYTFVIKKKDLIA
ncbi:hypothetical protein [Prevotella sp. 10(H)]|uniref:hypothetical protein n=1 Tax=Prevotella sp. 10(H) TaxID=1158294 RepID=UPI0004A74214|nr:hypothetical protein [Prevotella sp. 10(H)]